MKKLRFAPILLIAVALVFSTLACNLNGNSELSSEDQAALQTLEAVATMAAADAAAAAEEGAPDTSTEPDTSSAEPTPEPAVEATIVHLTIPGEVASSGLYITDSSSAAYASEKRSIADSFGEGRLERPFDQAEMRYLPYLDITRTELRVDSPWVYVTLFVEETPPTDSTAAYAVEIDLDLNGRGNYLIMGINPAATTWTTDGVYVYKDANFDVGGAHPMQADAPPQSGDGYETVIFDQGIGTDPDAAWIRISPSHPDRIQLAFKYAIIGSDGEFTWGVWTDEATQEAGWFDYHDHYTLATAGSPLIESSHYPLKELHSIDSTCRWAYGFIPDEPLPGLCPIYVEPTATPTPTLTATPTPTEIPPARSTLGGVVFDDVNNNRGLDSSDNRLNGVTVRLRQGTCPGSGAERTTTTSGFGGYTFPDLAAGNYCIQVRHSDLPFATYGWYNTTPGSGTSDPARSVHINAGESDTYYNFGFVRIIG